MPQFTPPTITVKMGLEGENGDILLGRYRAYWGQSVVKQNGHYITMPYPWLGTLRPANLSTQGVIGGGIPDLVEGVDWFLGGKTYVISPTIATALNADGFTTS